MPGTKSMEIPFHKRFVLPGRRMVAAPQILISWVRYLDFLRCSLPVLLVPTTNGVNSRTYLSPVKSVAGMCRRALPNPSTLDPQPIQQHTIHRNQAPTAKNQVF